MYDIIFIYKMYDGIISAISDAYQSLIRPLV